MRSESLIDTVRAYPPDQPAGGGGCKCGAVLQFMIFGQPTSGSVTWRISTHPNPPVPADHEVSIAFDGDAIQLASDLNATADFDAVVAKTPPTVMPFVSIAVQFPEGVSIETLKHVANTLDDGSMHVTTMNI